MTNKVAEFIKQHPEDWEPLLKADPYNITIKSIPGRSLYIFNYNMIKSDFTNPVVCQSRGLILRVLQLPDYPELSVEASVCVEICCWPFDKFFNIGETQAAAIDWSTAKVLEKVDGSIIKYWYDFELEAWQVSTNGVIDAFQCELQLSDQEEGIRSFGDLFYRAGGSLLEELQETEVFRKGYTYIFELTSPYNRVVVPHKDIRITLIGVRDNDSGEEIDPVITLAHHYWPTPRCYKLDKEAMLDRLSLLPYDEEGYVVVDASFNRVKAKSLAYLRIHRLKDASGHFSDRRIFDIVKAGETEEVLAYFPEYKSLFLSMKEKLNRLYVCIAAACSAAEVFKSKGISKKEFAEIVKQEHPILRPYMFSTWDGKDIDRCLDKLDVETLNRFIAEVGLTK